MLGPTTGVGSKRKSKEVLCKDGFSPNPAGPRQLGYAPKLTHVDIYFELALPCFCIGGWHLAQHLRGGGTKMPARSHVDLCMFIQILEIDEELIPEEIKPALLERNYRQIAMQLDALGKSEGLYFINEETQLHESIHIIQAVIYPFLRWYAFVAYKTTFDLFLELNDLSQVARVSDSLYLPALSLLDIEYYIWEIREVERWILFWKKEKFSMAMSLTGDTPANGKLLCKVNTTEIIENSASLIQYKFSTNNDFPTWKEYSRWTKRNPAYTRILDVVRGFLGDDDLAVRIFLPLTQVAFETNRPVQAFTIWGLSR